MNPHDETDLDGDARLINAMRELVNLPSFDLGAEILAVNAVLKLLEERKHGQE